MSTARTAVLHTLSVTAILMVVSTEPLQAEVILPSLPPGSQYQLIFVTALSRGATSANIDDYNQFVNDQAALNPALPSVNWHAIISTPTVAAKVNAPTYAGVNIYNSRAQFLAEGHHLWSDQLQSQIVKDQFGNVQPQSWTWTGSMRDGTIDPWYPAGAPNGYTVYGDSSSVYTWLAEASVESNLLRPIYAMSDPITVPWDSHQYRLTDLGTLGGTTSSHGFAINASGQVTGYATGAGTFCHAFLYGGCNMRDLGALNGQVSRGAGINDNGDVVGFWWPVPLRPRAFLYSAGTMQDLGTLGGATSSASDINSSGQIVGNSATAEGETHAFLYSAGTMQDLGTLGGATSSASDINSSGQIVGNSTTAEGEMHAFLYSGGVMQDLGTLGGATSYGAGINWSGDVVGDSSPAEGDLHAFLYSGGVMQDLGTLGGTSSNARSINSSGDVVGFSWTAEGEMHAFLYSGGVMQDLNDLMYTGSGWTLRFANAINDLGWITGDGTDTSGQTHAFLLTPFTACEFPTIVTSPSSVLDGIVGQPVTFSVGVAGTPPFTYAWYKDGALLALEPGRVAVAPDGTLTIDGIRTADAGVYEVVVGNGCGCSDPSEPATLTVYDIEDPTIEITGPTTEPTYLTHDSPLTISGIASDNDSVAEVTWYNAANQQGGTCSGTENWTCDVILVEGNPNAVTITAWDPSALISSDEIAVSYAPPLTIRGQVIYRGRDTQDHPARFVKVQAWERNTTADDMLIAEGHTIRSDDPDYDGTFSFPEAGQDPIYNVDSGDGGTRDIYIKVYAENDAVIMLHPTLFGVFYIETLGQNDFVGIDYIEDIFLHSTDVTPTHAEVFAIPEYFKYIKEWFQAVTESPGPDGVGVLYPKNEFQYEPIRAEIHLEDDWTDKQAIAHEYGHAVHHYTRAYLDFLPGWPNLWGDHDWWSETDAGFALTEGWADFFKYCYAYPISPTFDTNTFWMGLDQTIGMNPNGNTGEIVEGAVSSMLWDIWDSGRDDDDSVCRRADLWFVFSEGVPDSIWSLTPMEPPNDFYHQWLTYCGPSRDVDEIFIDHGIPVTDDLFDYFTYDLDLGNDSFLLAEDDGNLGAVIRDITYQDLICVDPDFYRFELLVIPTDTNARISVDFDRGKGQLWLYLHDANHQLLDSRIIVEPGAGMSTHAISLTGRQPGVYYAVVSGAYDVLETTDKNEGDFSPNYRLDIKYAAPPGWRYGDFDNDGDVDQTDFGHLQVCYTGANPDPRVAGVCAVFDYDSDGDVDQDDLVKFESCASGPAVPISPGCMD